MSDLRRHEKAALTLKRFREPGETWHSENAMNVDTEDSSAANSDLGLGVTNNGRAAGCSSPTLNFEVTGDNVVCYAVCPTQASAVYNAVPLVYLIVPVDPLASSTSSEVMKVGRKSLRIIVKTLKKRVRYYKTKLAKSKSVFSNTLVKESTAILNAAPEQTEESTVALNSNKPEHYHAVDIAGTRAAVLELQRCKGQLFDLQTETKV